MRQPVKTLSKNGLAIDVKQFADGRFGFDQRDEHGRQVKTRLNSLEDAVAAADRVLTAGTAGTVDLSRIDREDYLEFLRWRAARGVRRPILAVYVMRGTQTLGPFTEEQALLSLANGTLLANDQASADNGASWIPLHKILGMTV